MFQNRLKPVLAAGLALCGLLLTSVAHADATDTCFNFLNAQDYSRAESEAQALLKRKTLGREEKRYTQLCLGRAQYMQGRQQDSLPAFQQAERLSQTTEELAVVYSFLGLVYGDLDDLNRAELYDQRSLKANRELGNKSREATALINLAVVAGKRGDSERELTLLQEALAVEPDESKKSSALNNIAMIYEDRGDYERAISMLRQALDMDRRNGNGHDAAKHQLNLGWILARTENYDEAKQELTAGLNAIHLIGDQQSEATGSLYLARLEEARGNKAKAKQWFGKAESLYREIGNTASADQMRSFAAQLGK